MTKEKSLKKFTWIISIILAVISLVGSINIEILNILPEKVKAPIIGIVSACFIISTIFLGNKRTSRAEDIQLNDIIKNLSVYLHGFEIDNERINIENTENDGLNVHIDIKEDGIDENTTTETQ